MPETAAAEGDPKPDAADEDMADPPVKIARSRWLDEEPEEEPPEPVNKVRTAVVRIASLPTCALGGIFHVAHSRGSPSATLAARPGGCAAGLACTGGHFL